MGIKKSGKQCKCLPCLAGRFSCCLQHCTDWDWIVFLTSLSSHLCIFIGKFRVLIASKNQNIGYPSPWITLITKTSKYQKSCQGQNHYVNLENKFALQSYCKGLRIHYKPPCCHSSDQSTIEWWRKYSTGHRRLWLRCRWGSTQTWIFWSICLECSK